MSETERLRRHWDRHARGYDKQIGWSERRFFPNTRRWVCSQAVGKVLELAIGTGLNLPQYPNNIRLTGIDLSPAMLAIAADRARQLRRDVDLRTGDAERLRFRDNSFDTVVCTFSLCAIPDEHRAIDEALRVLRPDGLLLLADHVRATVWWARSLPALIDLITVRWKASITAAARPGTSKQSHPFGPAPPSTSSASRSSTGGGVGRRFPVRTVRHGFKSPLSRGRFPSRSRLRIEARHVHAVSDTPRRCRGGM